MQSGSWLCGEQKSEGRRGSPPPLGPGWTTGWELAQDLASCAWKRAVGPWSISLGDDFGSDLGLDSEASFPGSRHTWWPLELQWWPVTCSHAHGESFEASVPCRRLWQGWGKVGSQWGLLWW